MRRRGRMLSGIEALSIQGLHYKFYEACGTHWKAVDSLFKHRQLCHLAGKAFDANSMLVTLTVAMMLCDDSVAPLGHEPLLPEPCSPTDIESEDASEIDSDSPGSACGPSPSKRFRALQKLSSHC